ncbi:MAG: hypothetical protein GF334_01050 [Candidatus Altiarchaeales archaeon]|nr:hypothetical protein [Candidatus Altiarchaeales archaeon]
MEFNVRVSVPGVASTPQEAMACAKDVAEHIEKMARGGLGSYFVQGINDLEHDGDILCFIDIEGAGLCEVLGGLRVTRPKNNWKRNFIVVDDGGALMLYNLMGDTAVWYGSLCGTEAQRYTTSSVRSSFSYRYINYNKKSKKEAARIVELGRKYRYRPAKECELSGWK